MATTASNKDRFMTASRLSALAFGPLATSIRRKSPVASVAESPRSRVQVGRSSTGQATAPPEALWRVHQSFQASTLDRGVGFPLGQGEHLFLVHREHTPVPH